MQVCALRKFPTEPQFLYFHFNTSLGGGERNKRTILPRLGVQDQPVAGALSVVEAPTQDSRTGKGRNVYVKMIHLDHELGRF